MKSVRLSAKNKMLLDERIDRFVRRNIIDDAPADMDSVLAEFDKGRQPTDAIYRMAIFAALIMFWGILTWLIMIADIKLI